MTRLNQMIEAVKTKFRTLKSSVSQKFKSRESLRTFVTTQVSRVVKHANLEGVKQAIVAIRENIDSKIVSHFKSKKAFLQLVDPLLKKYHQLVQRLTGKAPAAEQKK